MMSCVLSVSLDWRPLPLPAPARPPAPDAAAWRPLAHNSLLDPPPTGNFDLDYRGWNSVEEPRAPGLTPTGVRALRSALFREVKLSRAVLGDWPMVRLLLTAAGALQLGSLDVGGPARLDRRRLEAAGVPNEPGDPDYAPEYVSFLEHRGRAAAGALRPADKYRTPYDEAGAKREWGARMLQSRAEAAGRHGDRSFDRGVRAASLWDKLKSRALRLQPLPGGQADAFSLFFL
jgi:hypothetical protein